ncbi:sn-glycerol-3-phosphate ABC transporter substrate-binding protein UgpB [Hafnia psychrotolerans]|uniref:sn-glycerol-3-phosphate-binding periplasmic protein UgpB n=1 Tax=Hafnia psychrotolerans TaxID=1477018 RepID=A0ABQ1GPZ2_9GAMM|nr:sn-glycerol-3-phosphate ABC transporter substrate-binding protein UgpB [Hafnia psychrotolerans]GGA48180.1 sn-glycerol-3-phosphate ABC transporter substrate-binding protein [Hafnia psychrotolerans]
MKKLTCISLLLMMTFGAQAQTTLTFWHSMDGDLGKEVNALTDRFNQTHPDYHIVPVYKGNYELGLAAGVSAYRNGNAPDILQVYEVGTPNMMASNAVVPVAQVFKEAGIPNDESAFVPSVAAYYSDSKTGHLISQPFNSSTPVLYYNKEAFKKAGLNPEQPPKTWNELSADAVKLRAAGMKCGYTNAGQQGWIQIEGFSAWNGLPVATRNNGFDGTDAKLNFNGPLQIAHIEQLSAMHKKGDFSYYGRQNDAINNFYAGDCGILTTSSAALTTIRHYAKFDVGVGMMPYQDGAPGAPQNAFIGGGSLWVFKGKTAATYKGVAEFLHFLTEPENAAQWHQKTGYLPITNAAYTLTQEQGFYKSHPGADTAMKQMLNKPPLPFTKGLRLGNMPQIRSIMDEELEKVWNGQETPKQSLDNMVARGNVLLRRFEQSVKGK